jgi:hypothetical protein
MPAASVEAIDRARSALTALESAEPVSPRA